MTSIGKQRMAARVHKPATKQLPRAQAPAPARSTTARGYGWRHQQECAKHAPLVAAGRAICWRCRRLIAPGEPWDLGHHDIDRTRYMGPEHASCNRNAAWRKAQRRMASHRRASTATAQFFNT